MSMGKASFRVQCLRTLGCQGKTTCFCAHDAEKQADITSTFPPWQSKSTIQFTKLFKLEVHILASLFFLIDFLLWLLFLPGTSSWCMQAISCTSGEGRQIRPQLKTTWGWSGRKGGAGYNIFYVINHILNLPPKFVQKPEIGFY